MLDTKARFDEVLINAMTYKNDPNQYKKCKSGSVVPKADDTGYQRSNSDLDARSTHGESLAPHRIFE